MRTQAAETVSCWSCFAGICSGKKTAKAASDVIYGKDMLLQAKESSVLDRLQFVSEASTCCTPYEGLLRDDSTPRDEESTKIFSRPKVEPLLLDSSVELEDMVDSPWRVQRRASTRRTLKLRLDLCLEATDHLDRLEAGQTGGVYKVEVLSPQNLLAIFKPEGQERFERRGISAGTGATREEAAYMLDRLVGSVAGVPVTVRAKVPSLAVEEEEDIVDIASTSVPILTSHDASDGTCSGSVQRFVPAVVGASEDFGMPRELTAAAAVVGVSVAQQVAALDIRLCNTDRHGGNLLFQKSGNSDVHPSCEGAYVPVPIDHGCALPRWWAMGEANFEAWSMWPQVKVDCLPEVVSTIEDAFRSRDEAGLLLVELGLEPAVQATYHIAVRLLREGVVRHGLCLGAIAQLMGRDPYDPCNPSWLEIQIAECAAEVGLDWHFEEDTRGDRVLAPPKDPSAWPPEQLLEKLEARFCEPSYLGQAGRDL